MDPDRDQFSQFLKSYVRVAFQQKQVFLQGWRFLCHAWIQIVNQFPQFLRQIGTILAASVDASRA